MLRDSIVPEELAASPNAAPGMLDRFARRMTLGLLDRLRSAAVTLHDREGTRALGASDATERYRVTVHSDRFYRTVLLGGNCGAGEAYLHGYWEVDDLPGFLRMMLREADTLARLESGWSWLTQPILRAAHRLSANTQRGSRRNIRAHYDISNDFYRLFLDESLTYSAGVFETADATLAEASRAKIDRACRKLRLTPDDHLLEIGTGWGALAIHAAREYGCRVTTTTISEAQYELAAERIAAAGLRDRIELVSRDYRNLTGRYDKLVSIEMIEAVGDQYYDEFFATCGRLLKPDGSMLLQAITMAERYYDHARRSVDFIKRYVFPGSCIPSIGAMVASAGRAEMQLTHLEDFGPHYARTLRAWRSNLHANREAVLGLGHAPSLLRLWDYYLAYCEAGFEERSIGVAQCLLTNPQCRAASIVPPRTALV